MLTRISRRRQHQETLTSSAHRSESGGGGGGSFLLDVVADPLYHLPPLGGVLEEPLRAALLHLLRDGGEGRERLAADPRLLAEERPVVGAGGVGVEVGALLDLDEGAEAGVGGDDLHGPRGGVDDGGLDAVAEEGVGADDAAEEEGELGGADRDGAADVEGGAGGVHAAGEGVDVDDVREGGGGGGVGELAEGGGGDAVPGVMVHVGLGVRADHGSEFSFRVFEEEEEVEWWWLRRE